MKNIIPPLLKRLSPAVDESDGSPIRKVMQLIEKQDDLLSLAAGEARFAPPQELIERACSSMHKDGNVYTSTQGIPQVREALADFIMSRHGINVDPAANILMTVGGMEAIYLATQILLESGDKVLLPNPGWGVMVPLLKRKGAKIEYYPLVEENDSWAYDADAIIECLDENTKLVVLNSPSNPTGAVLKKEGYTAIIEKALEVGAFIMSDEVYDNFVYEGEYVSSLNAGTLDNIIMINSFSKSFAITGWRLGYAVAHPWLIQQMALYKQTTSLCSFSIGQWAMADFLPESTPYLNSVRALCQKNMNMVVGRLNNIQGVKCLSAQGGFYVFPDFSQLEPMADKIFKRLLDGGVAVVPGPFFGSLGEGRVRIMIAADTTFIAKAIERVEVALG